jgi:hypothetical protein
MRSAAPVRASGGAAGARRRVSPPPDGVVDAADILVTTGGRADARVCGTGWNEFPPLRVAGPETQTPCTRLLAFSSMSPDRLRRIVPSPSQLRPLPFPRCASSSPPHPPPAHLRRTRHRTASLHPLLLATGGCVEADMRAWAAAAA